MKRSTIVKRLSELKEEIHQAEDMIRYHASDPMQQEEYWELLWRLQVKQTRLEARLLEAGGDRSAASGPQTPADGVDP